MKKLAIDITKLISIIIIFFSGAALTFRFLDGRMLIGLILMIAGVILLIRMVVVSK